MKIGWSPYAAPAGHNVKTQAGVTSSFAQLLASGYSTDAIREQRALGFGETGLLGIPRKAKQSPSSPRSEALNGSNRDMSAARAELGLKASASHRMAAAAPSAPWAATAITGGDLSAGRAIHVSPTKTTPLAAGAKAAVAFFRSEAAEKNVPSAYGGPFLRSRRVRSRRDIVLAGPDDGASLIIYLGAKGVPVDDRQIFIFYFVCSQYGVTLDAVRLFEQISVEE